MTSLSVTYERAGADLVVPEHPGSDLMGIWIPEDGITWPSFAMRRSYAPESDSIGGRQLLRAVPDQGQTTLVHKLRAETPAALIDLMDELEAATSQFTYTLTITADDISRSWQADAELPQWGQFESDRWKARLMTATITIPLNPYVSD